MKGFLLHHPCCILSAQNLLRCENLKELGKPLRRIKHICNNRKIQWFDCWEFMFSPIVWRWSQGWHGVYPSVARLKNICDIVKQSRMWERAWIAPIALLSAMLPVYSYTYIHTQEGWSLLHKVFVWHTGLPNLIYNPSSKVSEMNVTARTSSICDLWSKSDPWTANCSFGASRSPYMFIHVCDVVRVSLLMFCCLALKLLTYLKVQSLLKRALTSF